MNTQNNSTAIFVDFENLRMAVFERAYKKKNYYFNYNSSPQKVVDFCNMCVFDEIDENKLSSLYRIFFYSARPLKEQHSAEKINQFFSKLEQLNHTALRYGKLVKRGKTNNNEDIIVQKQVDMLLGIDMAEISIKKFVNKVVLIGYDSDMTPALKLARCNGVQTEIIVFDDLKNRIDSSLLKHCDFVKRLKIYDVYKKLNIINTE